jgi:hypothetical protein
MRASRFPHSRPTTAQRSRRLDYRIDGGEWQILTLSPSVGNFDLIDVFTDGVEADVEIRARNIAGEGDTSDVKAVTTTLVTPTLNIVSAVFTGGSGGTPASVATSIEEDGATGPFTLFGATHVNATTLTAENIEDGTGAAEDIFSIGPEANIADLDDTLSLTTTLPFGARMSLFVRDDAGSPNESEVFQIVNIEVDADAPTLSSGSPADNATDVAVDATPALTFSKPIFGVATKDFYLYEDIDTTPVLVETFTFDDATSATGDNGGSASISGAVITITPGADMSTALSIRSGGRRARSRAHGQPLSRRTPATLPITSRQRRPRGRCRLPRNAHPRRNRWLKPAFYSFTSARFGHRQGYPCSGRTDTGDKQRDERHHRRRDG